ncbi:MAG: penicillin-binding transpeptidase domain-containing protein [Gudongella sp.]|nr:penicillin-binding transpeptidase domain-containing protein [Gudongella sp.]
MNLKDKLFNRYSIIIYVLFALAFVLVFRLATLTIAQGEYYRDLSDNKRIKEVYTTAPRGEIRDRYGRLLAGNIPTFTVQLLKDELNIKDREQRNENLLHLIRLLEEDGVSYNNSYPLELSVIKYKDTETLLTSQKDPLDKALEILIENGLVEEFLNKEYTLPYEEHFNSSISKRALSILEKEDISDFEIEDYETTLSLDKKLIELINNDKTKLRKIVDNPVARELLYELLKEKNLHEDLILEEFSLEYQDDYINQKASLMRTYPYISLDSSPKDDFINLFADISMYSFLSTVIVEDDSDEMFVPGELLLQMIKDAGLESPVELRINNDELYVIYSFIDISGKENLDPIDYLIEFVRDNNIIENFVLDDNVKYLAQSRLIMDGVNPKISVSGELEYSFINDIKNWENANKIEEGSSLKEAFASIREKYSIEESLSDYEARALLGLLNEITNQGYLAYQPINIAYGISNKLVARIEEELSSTPGINISIEPVRYYPEGKTAAHILGYIGKISQPSEIEKYIRENNYSPSSLIGKTGIEESYELQLSGESGVKKVEVDVIGNTTNIIEQTSPVPGDNLYLSVDLELQKKAEETMEQTLTELSKGGVYKSEWGDYTFGINKTKRRPYINANSGAVVVIDVKTGETLAMVSYPAYDPNLFSTGINSSDWQSLFPEDSENPLAQRPLYNIATQTAVQPGSTFKMATALTALEKGLNPLLRIKDMGFVTVGNKDFHCLVYTLYGTTHGYENLFEALRDSCNYYFYTLALGRNQKTNEDIGVKIEIEDIVDISKKLGLNDKTGIEINIPAEVSGGVPDPQRKIITTKYLLKQMLQRNIRNYIVEGKVLSDEEIDLIIEEIISWTASEEVLSRNEVLRRLIDMGIEPELKLSGEREGLADKIKYTYLNQAGWNIADTLNVTIGQGQSAYTPIQMANYIATIANGGYLNKLTLIESIRNYDNSSLLYEHKTNGELIGINNYENLEYLKEGMRMVADDGTAKRVFQNFPVEVGVKTGTAEKSGINPSSGDTYDEFAWFVGFAPYEDPEIAVAAVIFQGGSGGYAAPMVRDIIAQYLGLNNIEQKNPLPIENSFILE